MQLNSSTFHLNLNMSKFILFPSFINKRFSFSKVTTKIKGLNQTFKRLKQWEESRSLHASLLPPPSYLFRITITAIYDRPAIKTKCGSINSGPTFSRSVIRGVMEILSKNLHVSSNINVSSNPD